MKTFYLLLAMMLFAGGQAIAQEGQTGNILPQRAGWSFATGLNVPLTPAFHILPTPRTLATLEASPNLFPHGSVMVKLGPNWSSWSTGREFFSTAGYSLGLEFRGYAPFLKTQRGSGLNGLFAYVGARNDYRYQQWGGITRCFPTGDPLVLEKIHMLYGEAGIGYQARIFGRLLASGQLGYFRGNAVNKEERFVGGFEGLDLSVGLGWVIR